MSDLLQNWPGRLPVCFLVAGVPPVMASLWAVDDASTGELMTDFYSRLLAGETDKLKTFTDASKALRQKYPDPFHGRRSSTSAHPSNAGHGAPWPPAAPLAMVFASRCRSTI